MEPKWEEEMMGEVTKRVKGTDEICRSGDGKGLSVRDQALFVLLVSIDRKLAMLTEVLCSDDVMDIAEHIRVIRAHACSTDPDANSCTYHRKITDGDENS